MAIYQYYEVKNDYIDIKFSDVILVSTLVNENFTLSSSSATPTNIANPFQSINITRDYYSISRTLRLWWNVTLTANTTYTITISNLKTPSGSTLPPGTITFTTDNQPVNDDDIDEPPTREPVDIEDYSIKVTVAVPFSDSIVVPGTNSNFRVVSVKPASEEAYFLDPEFNEGRIEIIFNQIPAANYISTEFFKVSRKKITSGMGRWEDLNAIVTSSPADKLVIIYLPSIDTVPVYGEPDHTYWEAGYRYRLKILGSIGPSVSAQEDIDQIDGEVPELGEWDGGAP